MDLAKQQHEEKVAAQKRKEEVEEATMFGRSPQYRDNPSVRNGGNPLLAAIQNKVGGGVDSANGKVGRTADNPVNPLLAAIKKAKEDEDCYCLLLCCGCASICLLFVGI